MVEAIRALIFKRLAQTNWEAVEAHNDIGRAIDMQNHYAILALLEEVRTRIQEIHTVVVFLSVCLKD